MKFDVAWKYKAEFKNRGGESRDERRLVPPSLRGGVPPPWALGLSSSSPSPAERPRAEPALRAGLRSERMIQTRVRALRASLGSTQRGAGIRGEGLPDAGGFPGGGLTQAESPRKGRWREPGEEGQEVVALRAGVQGSRVARSWVEG